MTRRAQLGSPAGQQRRRRPRAGSAVCRLPEDIARVAASWLDTFSMHSFSRTCRAFRRICIGDAVLRNILAGAFPLFFAFRADGDPGKTKLRMYPAGLFRRFAEARAALEPLPSGSQWCNATWTASSECDTSIPGEAPVRRTCGVVPVFLDRDSRWAAVQARKLTESGLDVPHWAFPPQTFLAYLFWKAQQPALDTLAWRVQIILETKKLASSHAAALASLPPVSMWAEPGWRSAVNTSEDCGCDLEWEAGVVPLIPGRAYSGLTSTDVAIDWASSGLPQDSEWVCDGG
eukprot:TRINITY_DN16811_c0_g1_i1.p1 TRINITY_DN16811_c0_g1~~TRINITY_DN16811_c0_g1_i1.p1  ORF type:complete len:289 (+),score=37.97 TRINITY_DN16811_c0_g1_i1:90-956(+)